MHPLKWPECPDCGSDKTFPRNPLTNLYTCDTCGMIFEWDEETGEKEKIRKDNVYRDDYTEIVKEDIKNNPDDVLDKI